MDDGVGGIPTVRAPPRGAGRAPVEGFRVDRVVDDVQLLLGTSKCCRISSRTMRECR